MIKLVELQVPAWGVHAQPAIDRAATGGLYLLRFPNTAAPPTTKDDVHGTAGGMCCSLAQGTARDSKTDHMNAE